MKYFFYSYLLTVCLALCSCSGSDYVNAIPDGSTALISIDMKKMAADNPNGGNILKSLLQTDNAEDCGIDLTSKIYLFESAEGNLGLCAKVNSERDLKSWLDKLAQKSVAQKTTERKGFTFTTMNGSWVVGFSSKALLVMGPVVGAAQAQMQLQMAQYLDADEDHGIKGAPIYEKIDSMESGMAMVAQVQALPEKMMAPFTIGAPKDADASQVLIAAEMAVKGGCLNIEGQTFSFNKQINQALSEAAKVYRPIQGRYTASMPANALMGMFVNVDGQQYIKLLQSNKGMQALLAGINAAIDMDNIIRSVNGDMSIVIPSYSDDDLQLSMAAQLANKAWTEDVDYWKQSCPKGGKISDWQKDAWTYSDGKTSFCFGVTADNQFYSGNSQERALASIQNATQPLPQQVRKLIDGKKMAMIFNLAGLTGGKEEVTAVTSLLNPLFGNIKAIVYSIK